MTSLNIRFLIHTLLFHFPDQDGLDEDTLPGTSSDDLINISSSGTDQLDLIHNSKLLTYLNWVASCQYFYI